MYKFDRFGEVREVEVGIDSLRVQVECEGNDVDITGALAVAQKTSLDAVSTGEDAELGGSDGRAYREKQLER